GVPRGTYSARANDGLALVDARISNAVRGVPPQNKPTGTEITPCRRFLAATLAEMPNLVAIVVLGRIAHDSVVTALGERPKNVTFAHAASHQFGAVKLFCSYHCSRLNTNTGVLTPKMFGDLFASVRAHLDRGA